MNIGIAFNLVLAVIIFTFLVLAIRACWQDYRHQKQNNKRYGVE